MVDKPKKKNLTKTENEIKHVLNIAQTLIYIKDAL